MLPRITHLEHDSKGVEDHQQFSCFFGLRVVRCREVELTTLNIALLGRQPKYCLPKGVSTITIGFTCS